MNLTSKVCFIVRNVARGGLLHLTQCAIRFIGVVMCIAILGGCASMPMQKVSLVSTLRPNTALVTFVRPSVFFGDGVSVNIWDGERAIGVLGAGTLLQYEAEPGEHLFLASAENWSYMAATLLPGRRYFIKANIFPGVIFGRVGLAVVPKTDSRIEGWLSRLDPMRASSADKQTLESQKQSEIRAAVEEFKEGKVLFGKLSPEEGL